MKILIISNLYPSTDTIKDQTGNMLLHHYATNWTENNTVTVINPHSFNLLQLFSRETLTPSFILDGIAVHNRHILRLPGDFLVKGKFKSVLNISEYDLILGCLPVGLEIADYLSVKFKIPFVAYIHNTDFHRSGISKGSITDKYRRFLSNAAGIAFVSKKLQKAFSNYLPETGKQHFMPGCISAEWMEGTKTKQFDFSKSMTLITPTRIVKQKNLDTILEALTQLANNKIKYSILGAGDDESRLKDLVVNSDALSKTVSFGGMKTHRDIRTHLDSSDIMILLSQNESFGLVYLEAMARGCLVIGTEGEGIDGVITHQLNGFLCKPNAGALAECLMEIQNMPEDKLQSISKKAIATADNYLYKVHADRFISCAQELI